MRHTLGAVGRAGLNAKVWRGMLVAEKVAGMTEPVTGQTDLVPGDKVARGASGCAPGEARDGRRGLRGSVYGAAGSARAGRDWDGGALVPRELRPPELTGQG